MQAETSPNLLIVNKQTEFAFCTIKVRLETTDLRYNWESNTTARGYKRGAETAGQTQGDEVTYSR